jgi:bifunctional DNA-binding transcriptional regulator/antitoxin component of YhaV-PrlF toxin-antitoxin module
LSIEVFKMSGAESSVTAQNQTSVPAEVRRRLGIGPGTRLHWELDGDHAVVSAKRSTLDEIHQLTRHRSRKHASAAQIRAGIVAGATRGRR